MINQNDCTPEACQTGEFLSKVLSVCFSVFLAFSLLGAPQAQADGTHYGSLTAAGAHTERGLFPKFIEGNIRGTAEENCAVVGSTGALAFKIGGGLDGVVTIPLPEGGSITTDPATKTFSWTGVVMHDAIVKGGPNIAHYDYDGSVNAAGEPAFPWGWDSLLHSPPHGGGGDFAGLSHITLCYTPGDPDITVLKRCPAAPVLVEGGEGGATYNYEVLVTNTGDGLLSGLQLSDTVANCSVAENLASIVLDEGDFVTLHVSCDALAPLPNSGRNIATVTANTQFGHEPTVSDSGDTNDVSEYNPVANCPDNAPPPIDVVKDCGDPMMRLVERTIGEQDILALQVCVDVTITNTGDADDETLVDILLTDAIAEAGGAVMPDIPDLAYGQSWTTRSLVEDPDATYAVDEPICYYPSMPTGTTEVWENAEVAYSLFTLRDGDLDIDALFSNTASVIGFGAFTGEDVTDDDDADCSICYSMDEGLPAECPLPDLNPVPLPAG